MAITANAVWEIRSTATAGNVNGGFYKTGASGVDYSQQGTAQYILTSGTVAASAVILHASAAADMVGNGLHMISGTNATAGWYEILSVVVGVSITVDRNCGTGAGSDAAFNIGGALSLGSSDDAVFETAVAGNKFYIKQGTYTLGGAVNISAGGSAISAILVEGYASTRGDRPVDSTRPIFDTGANNFVSGASWNWRSLQLTGSGTIVFDAGGSSKLIDCKVTNTSSTADRTAVRITTDTAIIRTEITCRKGLGVDGFGNASMFGCYIHDCKNGMILQATTIGFHVINCIFEACWNIAINCSVNLTGCEIIYGNTLFGGVSKKIGTGISLATGATDQMFINNIITGFATGISAVDAAPNNMVNFDAFNCLYGNTANTSNWTLDSTSITTDPGLSGVAQVTGTTATTAASVLTDSGANFANVVNNVDFCFIESGTGITKGVYPITSHTATTLTLSGSPGDNATADKVYSVITGHVYTPGTNAKSVGFPGAYPAALSTSYVDLGAVQAQYGLGSATSTDPGIANVKSGTGYNINGSSLTGILSVTGGSSGNKHLGPVRMG